MATVPLCRLQGPGHRSMPIKQWKVADVVAFLQTIELGHLSEAIKDNGVGELQVQRRAALLRVPLSIMVCLLLRWCVAAGAD